MRALLFVITLLGLSAAAYAEDKPKPAEHKIDFAAVITDVYGRPYSPQCVRNDLTSNPPKCGEYAPFTLGLACITALSAALDVDRGEMAAAKVKREQLAMTIADAEQHHAAITLDRAEKNALEERIAKAFPDAILVGCIWWMLEPDDVRL